MFYNTKSSEICKGKNLKMWNGESSIFHFIWEIRRIEQSPFHDILLFLIFILSIYIHCLQNLLSNTIGGLNVNDYMQIIEIFCPF